MTDDLKEKIQNFRAEPELVEEAKRHFVEPTPEEIAKRQKYAEEVAEMLRRGARLTQEEAELGHAVNLAIHYRDQLAHRPNDPIVLFQLTNTLVKLGKYEEALDYANEQQLNEISELIDARDKDDGCRCDCPSREIEGKQVPSENVVKRMYVPQRQSFCWLHKCHECGHLNLVSELHPEIANFHTARMDAIKKQQK